MRIPDRWMDNKYARFTWSVLSLRNTSLHVDDPFIPFFEYKIGPYKPDYLLYFQSEPLIFQYKLEIFAKMAEYMGYELILFIEHHYNAFHDKEAFIKFLREEAVSNLKWRKRVCWLPWARLYNFRDRMEAIVHWTTETAKQLREEKAQTPQQAYDKTDVIADIVAEQVGALVQSYMGKIAVYNQLHLKKLIQLLIALQYVERPGKKGQKLFRSFTDTDMTAILRQFEPYGDKKPNTIQKEIADERLQFKPNDPLIERLQKALDEFFFY